MNNEEKVFGEWEVNTSRYYPEGAVVLVDKDKVKLSIFEKGQREIDSCEIGDILDVIFDKAGKRRTPEEIMKEVDKVAFYDNDIEVEFDEFIVDEELVYYYDLAEGLTRSEYLEKMEREEKEEDLINEPVD